MSPTLEKNARLTIDTALEAAGWIIQNDTMNLAAAPAWRCGSSDGGRPRDLRCP